MRMSAHFWNSSKSVTKGVGLDDIGPGRAGRLETAVEVLEGLFHLRPHVALADAVAADVAGQLAGGVDDLAAAAHRHNVRVGRLSARHSDTHAFRLKPLDLENHSALLVRFAPCGRPLAHKSAGGIAALARVEATIYIRERLNKGPACG